MKDIKLITLAAIAMMITGCAKDVQPAEETMEVSFVAEVPQVMGTKAVNYDDYKVVCAVYENGAEVAALREVVGKVDGKFIFNPRLIKNHSYQIAFWAMQDGAYDVASMSGISRISGKTEENYDAFTNATDAFQVTGNINTTIELFRPFAKLNLGVNAQDLQAVKNMGYVPDKIKVNVPVFRNFDALESEVVGESVATDFEIAIPESLENFEVENQSYGLLSANYLLIDETTADITYTVYDGETEIISSTIPYVPLEPNYNTNIVGDLLTGTVNYTITLNSGFTKPDSAKPVE